MNLAKQLPEGNEKPFGFSDGKVYSNYVALDWSMKTMSIATMKAAGRKPRVVEMEANVDLIKAYAKRLQGSSLLCFEETTGSHWLYVELKDYFDEIIVCDPYCNALLANGAKTDKIDAAKLCLLLRGHMLKPVYHSLHQAYQLRKLVNAYLHHNKQLVRLKNQKSAFYRSVGKAYKRSTLVGDNEMERFIYETQEEAIGFFVEKQAQYKQLFARLVRDNQTMRNLKQITGIGDVFAVIIYSTVVEAARFPDKYHYWSYCGLVKHIRQSGGSIYGYRNGRFSRKLKWVYTTAAMVAISHRNDLRAYYEHLLTKNYPLHRASRQLARYIAKCSWAMMKNNTPYQPYRWRKTMPKD
ncbi:IS110 family transposase [Candidatus Parcubacteria bacterium]|nr:MAG: IS110 family transposase [Candidatus Parcubacteria bacterium]